MSVVQLTVFLFVYHLPVFHLSENVYVFGKQVKGLLISSRREKIEEVNDEKSWCITNSNEVEATA